MIAVDTGGTFTDVVLCRSGAPWITHKLLSTPSDPAQAVLDGIAAVLVLAAEPSASRVVHGSTVATNALLEGKGGRAAFITTAGFEDTLLIGRQHRSALYALTVPPRPSPIDAAHSLGVTERLRCDGAVTTPLSAAELEALPARLEALGVEAVAVSLLHAWANPVHERAIGDRLAEVFGDRLHLTLSHDLLPELREFERASTCAVNAVVAPRMSAYLGRLERELAGVHLRIMGSAGGPMKASEARHAPVHTVLSGPAGGVVGALALARQAGFDRIVTFDMGGTSTDVALCDGALTLTTEGQIADLPIRVPLIDIHTVGAGGGSIARVDRGGALRVGPASAGADPGPAAYGRLTSTPLATVTDANVVLGRLLPDAFLGGAMTLDVAAARAAVAPVAAAADLDLEAAALGVLRVAEATMARAVKVISIERGHDVRDFTLVAFGGAGGLHACHLAEVLGMTTVLVPHHPGLLSAVGMALAPVVRSFSRALMLTLPPGADPADHPALGAALAALTARADAALDEEGVPLDERNILKSLDLRYQGQSFEINVPAGPDLLPRFADAHQRLYGMVHAARPVEVVAARVRAEGRPSVALPAAHAPRPTPFADPLSTVPVWTRAGLEAWRHAPRDLLQPGDALDGPLLVTEYSSTTVVPRGWSLTVDPHLHLVLRRARAAALARDGDAAVSPIELEVFRNLFASVAEEMGVRLMRSAFSPNIKERRDHSCALFDARAEMIAQAAHIPVHLGSTPMSVQAAIDAIGVDAMKPGDVFVLNDPYQGGTHLPDITIVAPCFVDDEPTPRFFVANRAHHADVGGISPGSMPLSKHIDEEGLRLGPTRLDAATIAWICAGSRTPDERRGDLDAQLASAWLGVQRLRELCARYGAPVVSERASQLQDYTDRVMRSILAELADGTWTFEDLLDGDGLGATDLCIRCTLTIAGDAATLDLSTSDDQCPGSVNAVRAITVSAVNYAFRCLAPPDLPSNGGLMRPLTVVTRPGSIVDACWPAAVAAGNVETSQRIVDVVFGALALAAPDRIPAASCGSMNNTLLGGADPRTGRPFAYYETIGGGSGGSPQGPGASAVQTHMTNTLNTPIEALEHAYPFRVVAYAIARGTGGAGLHPGGDGLRRTYAFDVPTTLTLITERRRHAPWGLAGGAPGQRGRNVLRRADGTTVELPAKVTLEVGAGDTLEVTTPGGGGWGAPR